MKNKVTESDLIGKISGFPIKVVQKMCEHQVAQGNPFNPKVFQSDIEATVWGGGFNWTHSPERFEFWSNVVGGNFTRFFKKYPKMEKP